MENINLEKKGYMPPPEDRFEDQYSEKSRLTAALLAILLGSWGIHAFYLGNAKRGVIHLVLTMTGLLAVASAIWAIYDGIMLLCGKPAKDGDGKLLL